MTRSRPQREGVVGRRVSPMASARPDPTEHTQSPGSDLSAAVSSSRFDQSRVAPSSPGPEFLLPPSRGAHRKNPTSLCKSHRVSAIGCEILKRKKKKTWRAHSPPLPPNIRVLRQGTARGEVGVDGGHTSWKQSAGGLFSNPLHLSIILMASDTTHTEEVRVTRNSRSKMLRLSVWKTFCRGGK